MGRTLRRIFIAAVAVPGLSVGAVFAAAALPGTSGGNWQSATTPTFSAMKQVPLSNGQSRASGDPKTDGASIVQNAAPSFSFASAAAKAPANATEMNKGAAKRGTRTMILSINPLAGQGASTSAAIVALVTARGAGPAPKGTVSFGYYTLGVANGGATSGVLGASALTGGEATFTTTAGQLPVGGPQNGSITITASYSGDHFYKGSQASIIYYATASCTSASWPAASEGFPQVSAGDPEGYYIGQSNGWFTLYVTHPIGTRVIFSGTVVAGPSGKHYTDGLLLDVSSTKDERPDTVTLVGSNKLEFRMANGGDLDGFTFYAGCGTTMRFRLSIAGSAVPSSEVFLGASGGHPAQNPFVFKRL